MNIETKVEAALTDGPKTVGELTASLGVHAQSVRMALWSLKSSGQAMRLGRTPGEGDKRRHPYLWKLVPVRAAA